MFSILTGLAVAGAGALVGHLFGNHTTVIHEEPPKPSGFQRFISMVGAIADLAAVIGLSYAGLGYIWTKFPDKISAVFSWILTAFDWIMAVFAAALDILALVLDGEYDYDRKFFGRVLGTVAGFVGAMYLLCSLSAAPDFSSRLSTLGSAAGVGASLSSGVLLVGVMVGLGGMLGETLIGGGQKYFDYSNKEKRKAANVVAAVALCYVAVRFVIQRFL